MVILMGKGSIEAKYGLIGLKGLRYYVRHTILTSPLYILDKVGDNCTNNIDCTTSFQHSTCSMNMCACITGYREVQDPGPSVCVKSESSDKFEYNILRMI